MSTLTIEPKIDDKEYAKAILAELRSQRPYFLTLQLEEILSNAFLTEEFLGKLLREGVISRFEFLMLTREPPDVSIPSSPTTRAKLLEKKLKQEKQARNLIK